MAVVLVEALLWRATSGAVPADEILQEEITALELEEEEAELAEAEADEALSLDTERVTKESAGEQRPSCALWCA